MDLLPSWRDGAIKSAIIAFVETITDDTHPNFVPAEKRLATFDHDGTLFVEKPLNAQVAFIKQTLFDSDDEKEEDKPKHGSFFDKLEHKFANWFDDIEDDFKNITELAFKDISPKQFRQAVGKWIVSANHPRFDCPYIDLVYKPMRELLLYLHQNQFDIYIVSGSSTDFIRPWSQTAYKIDNHHILGSSLRTSLEENDDERLHLVLQPLPFYFDNGANKVKAIERIIAEQPIFAFGNSRGDIEMLRWTGQAPLSFCGLVHHTDSIREYAYSPDPAFHLGKSTLSYADTYNWNVVDMKNDWLTIF